MTNQEQQGWLEIDINKAPEGQVEPVVDEAPKPVETIYSAFGSPRSLRRLLSLATFTKVSTAKRAC